jgi:hypothetical protein
MIFEQEIYMPMGIPNYVHVNRSNHIGRFEV